MEVVVQQSVSQPTSQQVEKAADEPTLSEAMAKLDDLRAAVREVEATVERVAAARESADIAGIDFTLTARAESYFGGVDNPFADAVATPAPQPPAPLFPSFNAEVAQPPADESQVAVADSERNDGPVTAEDVPMSDLFPNFDATHDAPAVLAEPEVAATEMVPRLSELPPAVSVSQSRGLPTVSAPAESPFATPDSETTEPPAFSDAADSATTSLQNSPMIAMAEPQPDVNLFQDHEALQHHRRGPLQFLLLKERWVNVHSF